MPYSKLLQQISRKESDKGKIAIKVIKNPKLLPEVFKGLSADKASIKYGCEKILRVISDRDPRVLYPRFDFFVALLDSDNTFLKWGAIRVIANLAAVDSKNKIRKLFNKYFDPITGSVLITAANVIGGAAKIAVAKPELTEKITQELLKVEKAKYQTSECLNVALGHTIKSFDQFFDQIKDKKPVIGFIKKQLKNARAGTRKKAEKFLKKHKV